MKQTILLFLIMFLPLPGGNGSCLFAQTEKNRDNEVLFLNSINFNLPWAKSIYWEAQTALVKRGLIVKAESLSVPALKNSEEVNETVELLRRKYPYPPKVIVFIGDPGWIVCRELFDDVWKDVPVIITNARDYLPASLDILLSHEPLNPINSVPASVWRKGYNVTALRQKYYVKETIELMQHLLPEMKRIAFISDDRYISDQVRSEMENTINNFFPDLELDQLVTTHVTTEALLDTLRSYDRSTGLIYYSWFESHNKNDNSYLFDHIQEVIHSFVRTPLFLLAAEDLSNNTFAGGCYVSSDSYVASLLALIDRVLQGERPGNILPFDGGSPEATLCYPVLKAHNIPTSLYPVNAIYVNKPEQFIQRYKKEIFITAGILLLLIMAIGYYIRILRKTYSQLRVAKEYAEKANQLKSAFLANMSHEIRTPLNAIVGFSNMLPYTDSQEEMQEYIGIIENNTGLLLQLINDILDMAKIEAGTYDFHSSLVDVNQVMEEIECSMRLRINAEREVALSFEERLPQCMLDTDKNRLIQVLTNLVTNAIKFTQKGTIRMGYRLTSPDTICFYVSDTGCGMSDEQCHHVFERFTKFNPFAQGTGLGLSICKMIIEKQGGEIGVESVPGEGSSFWFTLKYTGMGEDLPTGSHPHQLRARSQTGNFI